MCDKIIPDETFIPWETMEELEKFENEYMKKSDLDKDKHGILIISRPDEYKEVK